MTENKLLVYLHGFGFDKNNNQEFVAHLAKKLNARLLTLDAPFASGRDRGGFAWYEVQKNPKKHLFDEKMDFSATYIIQNIQAKLDELGLTEKDVILAGRSQGALMALYLVLSGAIAPAQVISLCGFYPDEILQRGIYNPEVEILWIEAANDTVLTAEKKATYKNLLSAGCKLQYLKDMSSGHDNLENSILDLVESCTELKYK